MQFDQIAERLELLEREILLNCATLLGAQQQELLLARSPSPNGEGLIKVFVWLEKPHSGARVTKAQSMFFCEMRDGKIAFHETFGLAGC